MLGTLPSVAWIYPVIILSGVLITCSGVFGLTKFVRLIPHSIVVALIVYLLPRYTRVVHSSVADIVPAVIIKYSIFHAITSVETKTIKELVSLGGYFVTCTGGGSTIGASIVLPQQRRDDGGDDPAGGGVRHSVHGAPHV